MPDNKEKQLQLSRLEAILGNERTFQNYVRTAIETAILAFVVFHLAIAVKGSALTEALLAIGFALILASAAIFGLAFKRFRKNKRFINNLTEDNNEG